MNSDSSFVRMAAVTAMLSCPLALGCNFLLFGAFDWDLDTAFDPLKAIGFQPDPSHTLRWGWISDMFGYYLLLIPTAILLTFRTFNHARMYSVLFGLCGMLYTAFGALGAAMMTGTTENLFGAWATGTVEQQAMVSQVFAFSFHQVFDGVWNQFAMVFAGLWWLGAGLLMMTSNKKLAIFTICIGVSSLLDFFGSIIQLEFMSVLGLNLYLWLSPVWALAIGIYFWKNKAV